VDLGSNDVFSFVSKTGNDPKSPDGANPGTIQIVAYEINIALKG
jgi:hypothetical protein